MPDDAQWIDEAAEQQAAPVDIPPEGTTDPRAVEQRMREIQMYNQIMGSQGKNAPLPRPRPADADAKAYDENRGWDVLSERQKQMIRAKQIQQYNQIMKRGR